MKAGKIIRIMGPVVDVRFADAKVPKIKEALTVEAEGQKRTMEVA